MGTIRHVSLMTQDPDQVAKFYKEAFDLKETRRGPEGVWLTDGYMNFGIIKSKDVGGKGADFVGIHHIGFRVDDLEDTREKLELVKGQQLTRVRPRPLETEVKYAGPDNVVIDVTHTGWPTTEEEAKISPP